MAKPGHFATNPLSQAELDSAKVLLDKYGTDDESMPDLLRLLRRPIARLIVEIENNPNAAEELKRQARLAKKRATNRFGH
jgi:hypothetical protein